ncbi:MAG: LacI family DNA-binding transcriptional regulator [Deltaproteobacteria bacterium]|nr:LacI family DNA-binding transcriptional regulator [Deltaproteobacteria bacterium]
MNPNKKKSNNSLEKLATLADVAEQAQVSTATVSRCLNSPERVDPNTRERVFKAIDALSYTPNFGARAMAARRTQTVGAVIPTIENSIFARGIQAFQEELSNHGFTLLVASSSYKPAREEEQIKNLIARGAEGLLLIGYDRNPVIYEFLRNRKIPVLVTWAFDPSESRPAIGFNNVEAMSNLTKKIIELGHRQIGFITASLQNNDRARNRFKGIQEAMKKADLPEKNLQLVQTSYSIENGSKAFEKIMGGKQRPTVVIGGNDVLAVGALRKAIEMGFRIPDDVSVTGFDDIELAQVVDPPLTTVHVPHRRMGTRAAQILVALINGEKFENSEKLQTTIQFRGTLGQAPQ